MTQESLEAALTSMQHLEDEVGELQQKENAEVLLIVEKFMMPKNELYERRQLLAATIPQFWSHVVS